ncbi:nucleoside phosphorylase [Nocardioides albidus]|uniref:Uridine phosphorylase n=1 Tax=Nocardioides albidus TaxID=1517589 RepID=A0A5C4VKW5_9ACTN|nr:nucleoside phosphorylase [Nocardioides albidus]TNM36478.1 nucleoside phosphorylase [Nocardioides albidus]
MAAPGLQHHLHVGLEHTARYAVLPSDPAHCAVIAAHLDDATQVARNREFESWRGTLDGEPVLVTSTGVGGPSTALAIEELRAVGVDTFVRVGTSLTFQPSVRTGDLALATAAIRDEGTTRQYVPVEFPAVADPDVVAALRAAATERDAPHHVGVVHTKDSFYGEVEPDRMPMARHLRERLDMWAALGVLCSEMEMATVLTVARTLGARAGGLVLMWGDDVDPTAPPSLADLHGTAVGAVARLIADRRA